MEILLKEVGPNKDKVITIYQMATMTAAGWGDLEEAKRAIDSVPITIDVSEELLDSTMKAFESAGATVEILGEKEFSREEISERLEDNNRISPDEVGNLERKELLIIFEQLLELTEIMDVSYRKILSISNKIEEERKKAEEILEQRAGWLLGGAVIGGLIGGIIGMIYLGCIGFILGICIGGSAIYKLLEPIEFLKNNAKRERESREYLEENIPPLQREIFKLQDAVKEVQNSDAGMWARDIVGDDLFDSESIMQLYELVKNRRADNLKEALNKYDNTKHTEKMEAMQRAIQNASELTAEEAVKQTAYAKEIEKNTHETATAAKATAYHTRRIDKNTRNISKHTRDISKNTRRFR